MNRTLTVKEIVNGAEGICFMLTDDGKKEELLHVKNIEITIKKNKSPMKVMGTTATKHKANGWEGTGKMTLYYASSKFREMTLKYMSTGIDTYFDMYIENQDPTSTIGRQTVWIKQVNLDDVVLAKLDIDSTELDEEVNFTFNGAELLNSFDEIQGEII